MGYLVLALIIFGFDQLGKILLYGYNISLIGDFLWLKTVFNTGAAWGSFSGGRWIFIAISSVCLVIFVWILFSKKSIKSKLYKLSISLLLGGLLGNLFDRIVFEGVRDFIYLKFINFPVFNIADIAVTVGTILLIVFILFYYKNYEKNLKTQTEEVKNNGENDSRK